MLINIDISIVARVVRVARVVTCSRTVAASAGAARTSVILEENDRNARAGDLDRAPALARHRLVGGARTRHTTQSFFQLCLVLGGQSTNERPDLLAHEHVSLATADRWVSGERTGHGKNFT